jgi:flagellar biosynthesis/type III secretory pathway M-ring protein FliF/YscJ
MSQTNSPLRWWKAITKKQAAFLIAMFVIWVLLVAIFLILMTKGQV